MPPNKSAFLPFCLVAGSAEGLLLRVLAVGPENTVRGPLGLGCWRTPLSVAEFV